MRRRNQGDRAGLTPRPRDTAAAPHRARVMASLISKLMATSGILTAVLIGLTSAPASAATSSPPTRLSANAGSFERTFQPAYDYDADGCYPTPAIGPTGTLNSGLNPSGSTHRARSAVAATTGATSTTPTDTRATTAVTAGARSSTTSTSRRTSSPLLASATRTIGNMSLSGRRTSRRSTSPPRHTGNSTSTQPARSAGLALIRRSSTIKTAREPIASGPQHPATSHRRTPITRGVFQTLSAGTAILPEFVTNCPQQTGEKPSSD